MTRAEKLIYAEVHPAKLGADAAGAGWGLPLLWSRHPVLGLALLVVPPVAVSAALLGGTDLGWVRRSALGRYARRCITPAAQACRLGASALAAAAAWWHRPALLGAALLVIVAVWLRGLVAAAR